MTSDELDDLGGTPGRVCATCGHHEDDHAMQELEMAGVTARRVFCSGCDEFHDFLPRPLDD